MIYSFCFYYSSTRFHHSFEYTFRVRCGMRMREKTIFFVSFFRFSDWSSLEISFSLSRQYSSL